MQGFGLEHKRCKERAVHWPSCIILVEDSGVQSFYGLSGLSRRCTGHSEEQVILPRMSREMQHGVPSLLQCRRMVLHVLK